MLRIKNVTYKHINVKHILFLNNFVIINCFTFKLLLSHNFNRYKFLALQAHSYKIWKVLKNKNKACYKISKKIKRKYFPSYSF
jgi:hypothetical protein